MSSYGVKQKTTNSHCDRQDTHTCRSILCASICVSVCLKANKQQDEPKRKTSTPTNEQQIHASSMMHTVEDAIERDAWWKDG